MFQKSVLHLCPEGVLAIYQEGAILYRGRGAIFPGVDQGMDMACTMFLPRLTRLQDLRRLMGHIQTCRRDFRRGGRATVSVVNPDRSCFPNPFSAPSLRYCCFTLSRGDQVGDQTLS